MKYLFLFANIFFFLLSVVRAQPSNTQTISKAELKVDKLIAWIENQSIDSLLQHSTDSLYCALCFEVPTDNQHMAKQDFYAQHFKGLFNEDWIARIKRNKRVAVPEKSTQHDMIVLYTTHDRDEVAPGHEGAQFGFWLQEENGDYKLSGIEAIP